MATFKFSIEGHVEELDESIINMSVLLRTTLRTDMTVEKDKEGNPIVEIATLDDISVLKKYYEYGKVSVNIVEVFDRLIVEPRLTCNRKLRIYWLDKLCKNKDMEIRTLHIPLCNNKELSDNTLSSIWKPVRKFQDYGILLSRMEKPVEYHLIPISKTGPRGEVCLRYKTPSTTEKHIVLNDVCTSAYETLKKYKATYTHMVVISDTPVVYSISDYIRVFCK